MNELLARMIAIPSVNPELDPGGAGETELARFVAAWAETRGLETHWVEPVPGRPSVAVRAAGSGGGGTLMLNAHLDTVGVAGMSAPFEPRIEAGRMSGRGAMDMKASLAACLEVVAAAGSRDDLRGDVLLTAVADEEHGSVGTEAVLQRWSADLAIVTEPTDLELHVAHRGFAVVELELRGRASHTAQPERGVNVLRQLGRLLAELEARDTELRSGELHPRLGHGSWQPVLARGGEELFTTPAHASVSLERRTVPGELASVGAAAELEAMLSRLRGADADLDATVRTVVAREAFEVPVDGEAVRRVSAAAEAVSGRRPQLLGAPYWTDAALVAAAGIPTVLFGPVGGGIHRPDEWVDLASVETLRDVLLRVALDLCR